MCIDSRVDKNQEASIAGSVAAAHFIRSVAPLYNGKFLNTGSVAGVLTSFSSRCPSHRPLRQVSAIRVEYRRSRADSHRKLLPWLDGMMDADEAYFKEHGEPLFVSQLEERILVRLRSR